MQNISISGLIVLAIFAVQAASAQTVVNGSFETGDFTGWQVTVGTVPGSPAVLPGGLQPINGTPSILLTPPNGNFQAFIQSTGNASLGQAVSAVDLETFLDTTAPLPNSSNPGGIPIDGTAIKQSVTLLGGAKLTFSYGYQSREHVGTGLDETGYTINGVFHVLVDTDTPGVMSYGPTNGVFESFLPYQTQTITVGPGTDTLGFVSYNTATTFSTTALLVDNVIVLPIFSTVPGLTPNQLAVATYIDNNDGNTGGALGPLVTALTGLADDPASLGSALDQISPQSLQVFRNIAFDNATFTTLDVTNHLADLRDGLTGFDGSQLNVNDQSLSPGASRIKNHLHDPKDMHDPKEREDAKEMSPLTYAEPDRWSTFIAGDVILADLSHNQDLAHQDYTSGGVILGTDYRIDDHFTVGGLLAYSHTDADLDHIGSTATVDTYSIGLYGSYVDGGWYGNALVTYGFNSYTEDRNIAIGDIIGTNRGAPQGNQYTGSLTGGYEFQTGHFKYGPIASLQYVNLGINSFTEEGPIALNVQSESDESLRSQLGVEGRYAVRTGSMYLVPHASVTWQHEYLDGNHGITSQFNQIGGEPFTVQTTASDHDSALIDVGLDVGVAKNVTLFADYQTEAGEDDFFAQSVEAGVRISY